MSSSSRALEAIRDNNIYSLDSSRINDINAIVNTEGRTYLSEAVRVGKLQMISHIILKKGADIHKAEEVKISPLVIATFLGRFEVVECLVENGARVNNIDCFGNTCLMIALREGHFNMIEFLLSKGADVEAKNLNGMSPLLWATKDNKLKLVKLFLQKRSSYKSNLDLMVCAIKHYSMDIILYLLEDKKVDVDGAYDDRTLLAWAAVEGHLDIVKVLLLKGANANLLSPDGNTPLATAVRFKQSEVAKYLTDMTNICKYGEKGQTPLSWAIQNQDLDMVKWLLDHGSDYIVDSVFLDAIATKKLNLVKLLVEKGAAVNILNGNKRRVNRVTPLMKSLNVGSPEITKYLIENGAKAIGDGGKVMDKTPLFWAIQNQDIDLATVTLAHGAQNLTDDLFLKAIESKNFKMVQFMKEKGAVINPQNEKIDGKLPKITPLMKSLEVGSPEIAKYLIKNDAKIFDDFGKATGRTPLLWALKHKDNDLVKLILERREEGMVDAILLHAIESKSLDIVQQLKAIGAHIRPTEKNNGNGDCVKTTPLMKALDVGNIEIAKYLIDNGAKVVDDLSKNEFSYIVNFLESKNFEMVKLLADNGARLDTTSECGQTALIKAIEMENFAMIKYFVERGVNVNQANKNLIIPLVAALNINDFRTFQYLIDRGANIDNLSSDEKQKNESLVKHYKLAKERSSKKEKQSSGSVSNQEGANDAS